MTIRMPLLCLIVASFAQLALSQTPFDSLRLLATAEVYFDFAKANIRPDADSTLRVLYQKLPIDQQFRIHIAAHTDAIGSDAANMVLSERRANAVQQALEALGLPASSFESAAFAARQPATDNLTEANRQRNRRATIEVYQWLRLVTINGRIMGPATGGGVVGEVIIRAPVLQDTIQTDTSGFFAANLPPGTLFEVDVFAPGYFFETQTLTAEVGQVPKLEIPLKAVTPGASIDLKNFYFVGNEAILLPESEPELPKLLKFIQLNPFIQIEIAGHINLPNQPGVPVESWNYDLSVRRAKRVYDYLIEQGIDPIRLSYKGYGNWQMRFPTARSEAEQALNRRVEIKVLSDGK